MSKRGKRSAAFTLIEVMVAVMIISVVIMALIRMYANNNFLFSAYKKQGKIDQYASLLIGNKSYGFENKEINLYDLVSDFDLDDNLRRKLKSQKIALQYKVVSRIDLSEDANESVAGMVVELGNTLLKTKDNSLSMLRLRTQ
ncbi:type IV pilus modification PilV family protein [Sulfurimonas sp.]